MGYPLTRLRRNRASQAIRDLVAENSLDISDLIQPLFVIDGSNIKQEIKEMPGIARLTTDLVIEKVKGLYDLGIKAVALFPCIENSLKTEKAEESYNYNNLLNNTIRAIKESVPDMLVIADVALDPYTSHGQDGIVIDSKIDNDETIKVLTKQAISAAESGCDIIAPSDMMDGRIGAIRAALDKNNFIDVKILSYAAKYASCFYGPFRFAVGSNNNLRGGNKSTYQMDFRNSDEALREVALDIEEGVDMVMIKPAMPYLDIIRRVKDNFNVPIFAYQVSGEYSMLKIASSLSLFSFNDAVYESLLAIKRAGAKSIITYAAEEVAKVIRRDFK